MQLSLTRYGAIAAGGLAAFGMQGENTRQAEAVGIEPIELDISEDARPNGMRGLFHNAAEFLIISITGCEPKR